MYNEVSFLHQILIKNRFMANMKTPGVYIVEKNAFPNSVVEVPTSIPVFIGIKWKGRLKR